LRSHVCYGSRGDDWRKGSIACEGSTGIVDLHGVCWLFCFSFTRISDTPAPTTTPPTSGTMPNHTLLFRHYQLQTQSSPTTHSYCSWPTINPFRRSQRPPFMSLIRLPRATRRFMPTTNTRETPYILCSILDTPFSLRYSPPSPISIFYARPSMSSSTPPC